MADPELPPPLLSEGAELAAFDAVIAVARALTKYLPAAKEDICGTLNRRIQQHQQIVDDHGAAVNANAASALRLIMLQIGCEDVPRHE